MDTEQRELKHNNIITELTICRVLLCDLHKGTNEPQYLLTADRISADIKRLESPPTEDNDAELTESEVNALEGLLSAGMLEVFHDQGQEALDHICVEMSKALDKIEKAGLGTIEPMIVT